MKHITQTLSDVPYTLVNFGVDTLVLNVRYADASGKPMHSELTDEQIEQLNVWQTLAKEAEEPVPVPVIFQGVNLLMHPHGAGKGQWRWVLTSPLVNLCISRGRLNGVIAQVRLSSQLLWSSEDPATHRQDLWTLLHQLEDFLTRLFQVGASSPLHLQVSEVHLCADLAGWDVEHCYDWQATILTRARRRRPHASFALPEPDECSKHGCSASADGGSFLWHGPEDAVPGSLYNGHRLETLEFGSHGSSLSCSIYNKSREIANSHKVWFQDIWRLHGYQGAGDVWRVEFRWKREALHMFKQEGVFHGIESVADLRAYLPYLWTYSAGHIQGGEDGYPDGWLRYVAPSDDTNPARWPVHPAWLVVQSAFTTQTETAVNIQTGEVVEHPVSLPLAVLIRDRQRQINVKKLAQQMGGCASTMSAWLSEKDAPEPLTFFAVCDWLLENLPAYAFPHLAKQAEEEDVAPADLFAHLQERYEAVFTEKALDKQILYGRRSTIE